MEAKQEDPDWQGRDKKRRIHKTEGLVASDDEDQEKGVTGEDESMRRPL